MKTIVPKEINLKNDQQIPLVILLISKKKMHLGILAILVWLIGTSQTYTTKANGSWSSASTWQSGLVPPTNGNITSGMVINIKHIVTYSSSSITNLGTINLNNPGGLSPRLIIASGINFTNKSGGKLYINNGELRQYRFAGGGETGTQQTGNFTNNGGYVSATNSFIEIAQGWSNQGGGIITLNNCSLEIGQGYSVNNSTDSLLYTSISLGSQGSGDFSVDGGNTNVYFKTIRVEVASTSGKFSLNNGTINGYIDYITLKNHITNTYSSDKIIAASNIVTSGIKLNAYCIGNPANYVSIGKFIGNQTPDCSLNYFPAGLFNGTTASNLNFSKDPVLISGTDKQAGAQYKYESVAPGIDALVKIDSIVGGATINSIDDNTGSNGGYIEGFQPIITSGMTIGSSYAVFSFNYKVTGTSKDMKLDTAVLTAVDIDGTSTLHEFDQISLGASATALSSSLNLKISLSQIISGTFKAIDISGISQTGIDTSAKANMFTVTNNNVSSFSVKMGMATISAQKTQRLFSIYAKSFNYPNQAITLPVNLVDFTAHYNKTDVTLAWQSAQEVDFNYYELEHSTDGSTFTTTSLIFGAGQNGNGAKYSYADKSVAGRSGLIYYRLKMVDKDGRFTYSSIRIVRLGEDNQSIALDTYPNPVTNDLRITLPSSWQNKQVIVDVYNASGQHVNSLKIANSSQTESISVASLQKGIYFVKVNCGSETATQRIIKN